MTERLLAIDLDRFLINTDMASEVFERACANNGLDETDVRNRRLATEASGKSFNALTCLRDMGHAALFGAISQTFIEECQDQPITYEDTFSFLSYLDDNSIPNIIVTKGGVEWQATKIAAAGLESRMTIITDKIYKGELISSWRTDSGSYLPPNTAPNLLASRVLLGDDKAVSFGGLPENCGGYLLRRPGDRSLRSQQGGVPPQVKTVNSLTEITLDLAA